MPCTVRTNSTADERLLGWLYVGDKPGRKSGRRTPIAAKKYLSSL